MGWLIQDHDKTPLVLPIYTPKPLLHISPNILWFTSFHNPNFVWTFVQRLCLEQTSSSYVSTPDSFEQYHASTYPSHPTILRLKRKLGSRTTSILFGYGLPISAFSFLLLLGVPPCVDPRVCTGVSHPPSPRPHLEPNFPSLKRLRWCVLFIAIIAAKSKVYFPLKLVYFNMAVLPK